MQKTFNNDPYGLLLRIFSMLVALICMGYCTVATTVAASMALLMGAILFGLLGVMGLHDLLNL